MAIATVTFRPFCPHTCLYGRSPCLALPWLLEVEIFFPHSSTKTEYRITPRFHKPVGVRRPLFKHVGSVSLSWEGSGHGKACRPESSRRCGHVWMEGVSVAVCLSATKWADSSRLLFPGGNFASLRQLERYFGLPAVFPGSFPLVCISLPQILLSTCSPQVYPLLTGYPLHRPRKLALFSGGALRAFSFLVAYPRLSWKSQYIYMYQRLPNGIGGFRVTSSRPCWWTRTIDFSLAPFVRPPAFVHFTIVICISRDWLPPTYTYMYRYRYKMSCTVEYRHFVLKNAT